VRKCGPATVRVQFRDPQTGELTARVPAFVCALCGDVLLGANNQLDVRGHCSCCARLAEEKSA
jgi:hypothetical protein